MHFRMLNWMILVLHHAIPDDEPSSSSFLFIYFIIFFFCDSDVPGSEYYLENVSALGLYHHHQFDQSIMIKPLISWVCYVNHDLLYLVALSHPSAMWWILVSCVCLTGLLLFLLSGKLGPNPSGSCIQINLSVCWVPHLYLFLQC